MNLIRVSSDRMVNIELEAAEALAGLAQFRTSNPVCEQVKDESTDRNSLFHNSSPTCYQEATNLKSEKPLNLNTANSIKDDEHNVKLRPNQSSNPTNCASGGRKSRQILTEAEIEARKIRRVLANRESARQTIRRRQAVFEELSRKAVDLAWENEDLKKRKETASKQYDSLKTKNQCLKAQVAKITNNEAHEAREESVTTHEPAISASSTNSSFLIYNQPSFLPVVWPSSVGFFPNHHHNPPKSLTSSSCEEGSSIYLLPYPCLVTLPPAAENHHPHSFNLNDKPKESIIEFFPEKRVSEPPDGGGGVRQVATADPVSCEELVSKVGDNKIQQVPVVCSGKRSSDTAAATEARKRRKQLTRLKNHFHCRIIHG